MTDEHTSPAPGATPAPGPATGPTAQSGATPATTPTLTLEDALKRIADLERSQTNASEEVERHRKKLTAYEKAERERESAAQAAKDAELGEVDLTKKQLAALQEQHDSLAAELYETRIFQDVARYRDKFKFVASVDSLADLLVRRDERGGSDWKIEFENGRPTNIEKLLDQLAKHEPTLTTQEPTQQQTAQPNQQQARPQPPAVPAMNPGRAAIPAPGTVPAGRRPSLAEAHDLMKQRGG